MAPRNVAPGAQKVPDDPIWIDITRSDGEQRTWPSNTTYIEDANGEINWMKHVPIDQDVALRWRLAVGNAIALDSFPADVDASRAILRDWPANYRMYNHHKGKAGAPRQDIYLYGPVHKRFRSIKEFIPHAIWLYRDETMNTKNCMCKYCTKLPQRVISTALDSILQTPSQTSISAPPRSQGSATGNAGPSTITPTVAGRDIYSALQKQGFARRERDRDSTSLAQRRAQREQKVKQSKGKAKDEAPPKVFASVQKQLKPMSDLKPSEDVSEMPMLADRNRDLRAVYSRSANDKMGVLGWDDEDEAPLPSFEVQAGHAPPPAQPNRENPTLRRYFRENEIVWVQLPGNGIPMASLGATQEMNISVWPGMVKGSKIKNTPVPISQSTPIPGPSNANGSMHAHQGKPLSSASTTNAALNGLPGPFPPTSSAGVDGTPGLFSASAQFPSTASSLHPQPSSTPASTSAAPHITTANDALSTSASHPSSPGLRSADIPVSSASSSAPNVSGSAVPAPPALPSRIYNPAPASESASATSGLHTENSGKWIVKESILYTVQLSAVDARLEVPATDVLPYLATAPADDFVQWLKDVPGYLNFERDSIRSFDPMAAAKQTDQDHPSQEDAMQAASRAISAYALALQTASHVCNDWSLTDKWDFEYVPPGYETGNVRVNVVTKSPSTQSGPSTSSPPASISAPMRSQTHTFTSGLSLASAIEGAGRANAEAPTSSLSASSKKMNLNAMTGTAPIYSDISGVSNSMTEEEVRQTAAGVLGVGPGDAADSSSQSGGLTQIRFQGMWWGSERVWVDDFVRVKVPRGALAPDGAPNVYKPSGCGAGTILRRGTEETAESLGTHTILSRGVFMKVGGIFVVDVPKPDGTKKKEARICGMLYELADLDWEEVEPDLKEQYELEKKQRIDYLSRHSGPKDPVSVFKASVDESLLPSTPNKPSTLQTAPPQPSPPSHYIMPQAPKGYRFRPILKAGYEAVLNLSLIAGRYYPRITGHPLLAPKFLQEWSESKWDMNEKGRSDLLGLMSLEGLAAGHYNAVDPQFHKKSRVQMLEDAELAAFQDMVHFKSQVQGQVEEDYAMDDDMDEDQEVDVEMVDELSMNVD
ncbi:hypothetical protein NMY22_g3221 [Coprinellus aureogranulatus]|nr:hypothetical protein NMY22_g3221 [Coprinellus aureogranulatus]